MTTLFDTLPLGPLMLKNRIIMAPLTRMRSQQPGNIPWSLNAKYYGQRASAGLIISEATQISQQGQGYPGTPGIHSPEQVEGWRGVTHTVHEAGGHMFLQLWHVGRISHPSFHNGEKPVAPSAIAPKNSETFTADWKPTPILEPRALETSEIPGIITDYEKAAQNAQAAGFDGVELHGANGYLVDQFLQDGSNKRTDRYGGTVENRVRFLLEVIDALISVWGKERVGIRLSPYGTFNDMCDHDPVGLFSYVVECLNEREIAYIHMIEPRATNAGGSDKIDESMPSTAHLFRHLFKGVFLSAGGYTPNSAAKAVGTHAVDAVVFGRLFISNPDLPERIKVGATLNPYNRATFYGGRERGYTDYPFMESFQNDKPT